MKRFAAFFCIIFAFGVGWNMAAVASAQEEPAPADPAEQWQSLSTEAFLTEADRLLAAEQTAEEKAALQVSLATHSAERLLALDAESTITRDTFLRLYALGNSKLTLAQQETISLRALPPSSETESWAFDELRSEHGALVDASIPVGTSDDLVSQWAESHSITEYSDSVEQLLPTLITKDASGNEVIDATATRLVDAIRTHAGEKLQALGSVSDPVAEERILYFRWGRHAVPGEDLERVTELVFPKAAEMVDWNFEKLNDMSGAVKKAGVPRRRIRDMSGHWLQSHADDDLSVGDTRWLYEEMSQEKNCQYKLEATWTGSLTATTAGSYSFSICPININADLPREKMRQAVAVWVDGKQVVDSTPANWAPDGGSLTLEAGKKTDIRFEWTLECDMKYQNYVFPAVAQLLWQGPGISKSVVPCSALTPPSGEGNGLQGNFRLSREGEADIVTQRVDPNLDMVWDKRNLFVSPFRSSSITVATRIHEKAIDAAHLAQCELDEGNGGITHEYLGNISTLEMLTSPQRAEFVSEVLRRPPLLEKATGDQICALYFAARVGSLDAALEMLGRWCQMHADGDTVLTVKGSPYQRSWYKEINLGIVWQYAPHHQMLEAQYLEMPDGGCSLPAAYILTHSYKDQDRFEEWIEKLDARLEEKSLTGDQRVNWLLARGYAEEIRRDRAGRYRAPHFRRLAGRGWIETACLVAQTEPVRLRAYKELMVRRLPAVEFDKAREVVATAQGRLTSPASVEAVAAWDAEIDRLEAAAEQERAAYVENANKAYRDALRERLAAARERGDDQAVADCEEKLQSFVGQ